MPTILQKQSLEKQASTPNRQSGNKRGNTPAVSRSNFFTPSIQLNPGPGFPSQAFARPAPATTQSIIQRQTTGKTSPPSPWDQLSSFDKQLMIKSFNAYHQKKPEKTYWMWKEASPQACYNNLAENSKLKQHFQAFNRMRASLEQFGFWKYVELLVHPHVTSGKRSMLTHGIKFAANPTLLGLLIHHTGFCRDDILYHIAKEVFSKEGAGGNKWREIVPTYTTGLHIEPGPVYDAHFDLLSPVQGKHSNGACQYHLGASLIHFLYDEKHKEWAKNIIIGHQPSPSPWQVPSQEGKPYPVSMYLNLGVRF